MRRTKSKSILDVLDKKKIFAGFIILIIILSIITVSLIIKAIQENQAKDIVVYTENSLINYNVYLKNNEFYKQEYLTEDKQYITSLINSITANFTYELESSEPHPEKYAYKYKIVAETNVQDRTTQKSVYKFSEDIVSERKLRHHSNTELKINENVKIDYNKYNDIIEQFIGTYDLDGVNPTVTISMYLSVDGVTKQMDYEITPVASLVIPLATRTMAINTTTNKINSTDTSLYKEIARKDYLYIAVLTFALTMVIIIELTSFINNTKDEKAVYKMKIKKILLNYDSYIQKLNNSFDLEGYRQLQVGSFEDLLQVRDTINEPILMIEKRKDFETNFIIISKNNLVYIYKLNSKEIKKEKENNKIQ